MNPVQQKISCVYKTGVVDEPSGKRHHQTFKVAATRELKKRVIEDQISSSRATEKLDGTCCLIAEFQGQPWLWARHDRKPSKVGERRFAQYKRSKAKSDQGNQDGLMPFVWDPKKDFKDVPEYWIPALRLEIKDGVPMSDDIGHTPGWVPVQIHQRQHCWHLEAVDFCAGEALILREGDQSTSDLVIESVPLSSLVDKTCELIGTNINGNPYGLGSKKNPFHVLVIHGSLTLTCPDPSNIDLMWKWMAMEQEEEEDAIKAAASKSNRVEGIVWHCGNGQLYKLHRHHLNMKWPVDAPSLCQRKVHVRVNSPPSHEMERMSLNPLSSSSSPSNGHREEGHDGRNAGQGVSATNTKTDNNLFRKLSQCNGQWFESLKDVCDSFLDE